MEQLYSQATTILVYVIGVLTGLLALDHLAYLLAKLSGNTKLETVCCNIALKIQKAITAAKTVQLQPAQPPASTSTATAAVVTPPPAPPTGSSGAAMSATILLITLLCVGIPTWAQTPTTTTSPAISISGSVSSALQSINIPNEISSIENTKLAVNTGFYINGRDGSIDPSFTYSPWTMALGTWGYWDEVNIGYASPNILLAGTGISVNLGTIILKKWGMTFSQNTENFLNSCTVELAPSGGIEQLGGKNRGTYGAVLSIKISV